MAVEFKEEQRYVDPRAGTPRMARYLLDKGWARDIKQANLMLLITAVVLIILAGMVWYWTTLEPTTQYDEGPYVSPESV